MRAIAAALAGLMALAAACAGDGIDVGEQPGVRTLAKVDGHRTGIAETGVARLAELVGDVAAARAVWDDLDVDDLDAADGEAFAPGRYHDLDDVDFDAEAVVVLSAGESGTCPERVADLDAADGEVRLVLDRGEAEVCTDDYRPYTAVLAVDRARLPAPDELPLGGDAELVAYSAEPGAEDDAAPREPEEDVPGEGRSGEEATRLEVVRTDDGEPARSWRLTCGEEPRLEGGAPDDVEAEAACEAVADHVELLTQEPDPEEACTQQYGGPEEADVVGLLDGDDVQRSLHRRDGCGIHAWDALAPLLGAPGDWAAPQ